MNDLILGCTLVGGLFIACLAWIAIKWVAAAAFRGIVTSFLPFETKTLEWLQDRAMARAIGVDVDVVRMRRRMETLRKPMNVSSDH
jgi:hypothetical protein